MNDTPMTSPRGNPRSSSSVDPVAEEANQLLRDYFQKHGREMPDDEFEEELALLSLRQARKQPRP